MSRIRYQFQIYARGVTATSGSVSYTYQTSQFAHAPFVGGQTIRPAEAHVESTPWSVDLVDLSGTAVSANLASTAGRMHLLGRMARLRASHDSTASTAYQTVAVSRITDVSLGADVASYRLTLQDERWIERQTDIFTKSNTCMLIPSGLIDAFGGITATPPASWKVRKVTGNLVCLEYLGVLQQFTGPIPVVDAAARLIADDVIPGAVSGNTGVTAGNFQHLRFTRSTTAVSYEVSTFSTTLTSATNLTPNLPGVEPVPDVFTQGPIPRPFFVWLVWASSQPSAGDTVQGYLHMPTHEPTDDLPLHVGGSTGVHPMALWETIYTGAYSGTTGIAVRSSTARFAALKSDQSYGTLWLRITKPYNMASFIEDHLAAPYHVAPVVDSSGRIAPTSLRMPDSTAITVSSLLPLGSSNCISHPTWEHPSQEAVTVIKYHYPQFAPRGNLLVAESWTRDADLRLPVDGIRVSTGLVERTHDTVTQLGRRVHEAALPGSPTPPTPGWAVGLTPYYAAELADHLAQNVFPRLGDGPIWSSVEAMDAVDRTTRGRLMPGAFVKATVQTQPNPASNARGSTRIMQVMSRDDRPDGPSLRLLDAGPNLAVLSAPTITLALSSQSSRHAIRATMGSVPSGAKWQVQLSLTSTGTTAPPASTAGVWFPVKASSRSTSSTTFVRGQLPSNTKVWGRVRATQPHRIGSTWGYSTGGTITASIAAPTLSSVGSISAGTAIVKFTASSQYATRIMVDASTGATLGSSNMAGQVPPFTTRFQLVGLNANDSHVVGVQRYDPFGGFSAQDSTTFTTTTSYTALNKPRALVVTQGA